MFNRQHRSTPFDPEGESPWISFTDLMAGFLVVILLALTAAIIMLTMEKIELRKEREIVVKEIDDAIERQIKSNKTREDAINAKIKAEETTYNMIRLTEEVSELIKKIHATQNEIVATIEKMDDFDRLRKDMLMAIKNRLERKSIQVEISQTGDILHISEDNLSFSLGSYKIEERFKSTMLTIGEEVAHQLNETQLGKITDTVFVEGHTDNVTNKGEMGNWGLSAYRAISLWQFWEGSAGKASLLNQLKNSEGKSLFSVNGYGETRPRKKFTSDAEIDQFMNRRIDLRFNLQSAKSDLLKELLEKVKKSQKDIKEVYDVIKKQLPPEG